MSRVRNSGTPNAENGSGLSDEERHILLHARRKIWIDGMKGMIGGGVLGGLVGVGYQRINPKVTKSMALTVGMLGGLCFGGFLYATTAARNTIPYSVEVINQRRKNEFEKNPPKHKASIPLEFTPYQTRLASSIIQEAKKSPKNNPTSTRSPNNPKAPRSPDIPRQPRSPDIPRLHKGSVDTRNKGKNTDVDYDMTSES
ncbi:hypothetical protein AAMO2058_001341600 [Amorphochlora amoebiformis]